MKTSDIKNMKDKMISELVRNFLKDHEDTRDVLIEIVTTSAVSAADESDAGEIKLTPIQLCEIDEMQKFLRDLKNIIKE